MQFSKPLIYIIIGIIVGLAGRDIGRMIKFKKIGYTLIIDILIFVILFYLKARDII